MITDLISLLIIGLFNFSTCSWYSLGWSSILIIFLFLLGCSVYWHIVSHSKFLRSFFFFFQSLKSNLFFTDSFFVDSDMKWYEMKWNDSSFHLHELLTLQLIPCEPSPRATLISCGSLSIFHISVLSIEISPLSLIILLIWIHSLFSLD